MANLEFIVINYEYQQYGGILPKVQDNSKQEDLFNLVEKQTGKKYFEIGICRNCHKPTLKSNENMRNYKLCDACFEALMVLEKKFRPKWSRLLEW